MGNFERAREYLKKLVAIESVTGNEDRVIKFLESSLPIPLTRHRDNVFYIPPTARFFLIGHMDTVPWNQGQKTGEVNGQFFGRGSVDMKAGLALMCDLAHDLPQDVGLIFYSAEEGPLPNGITELLAERREIFQNAELALLLEPTNAGFELGCRGSLHATITIKGKSAHSARPHLGRNPIELLPEILKRLSQVVLPDADVDGIFYKETFALTQISAGEARNMIPSELKANLNFRYAPNRDSHSAWKLVQGIFEGLEHVSLQMQDPSDGARPFAKHALIEWAKKQGYPITTKDGWTDVAQVNSNLKIPAYNFGPGDPKRAHTVDEGILWDEFRLGVERLTAILEFLRKQ